MSAPIKDSGWLPIATAPRDGTRIIAWCVHRNAQYSKDPVAEGFACPVFANWIDHNHGGWTWYGLAGTFTHWMPEPSPPAPQSAAETGKAVAG